MKLTLKKSRLDIERGIRPTMPKVITVPVQINSGGVEAVIYVTVSMFGPQPTDKQLREIAQRLTLAEETR